MGQPSLLFCEVDYIHPTSAQYSPPLSQYAEVIVKSGIAWKSIMEMDENTFQWQLCITKAQFDLFAQNLETVACIPVLNLRIQLWIEK